MGQAGEGNSLFPVTQLPRLLPVGASGFPAALVVCVQSGGTVLGLHCALPISAQGVREA